MKKATSQVPHGVRGTGQVAEDEQEHGLGDDMYVIDQEQLTRKSTCFECKSESINYHQPSTECTNIEKHGITTPNVLGSPRTPQSKTSSDQNLPEDSTPKALVAH